MFNFKTIQSKILLILVFTLTTLILITYSNYKVHQEHYTDFINFSVNNTVDNIKLNVNTAEVIKNKLLKYKYNDYQKINKYGQSLLINNPKYELDTVKKMIKKKFTLDVNLYLINNKYTIYQTTDPKDLHLNMLNFMGAKEYIDKAVNDNTIITSNPSYDLLSKQYITYSYMLLNKENKTVLEIGIHDKIVSEVVGNLYKFNIHNSIVKDLELFADYGKYVVNFTKDNANKYNSKQNYITQKMTQSNKELSIVNNICKKKREYKYTIHEKDKTYIVLYSYIASKYISLTKVKNYVLKTKIDVSEFERDVNELKQMFYLSLIFSIILVFLFYMFLNYSFISPMQEILEHTREWKKIKNLKILNKEDELSELARSFNRTYEQQKEFNSTLKIKINEAVKDIKQKEKLLQSQSRLAQIGELLGMIAHQWRQPLGAISSAIIGLKLQLNIKEKDFNTSDENKLYLESTNIKYDTINEYVQFLSTMIDDFKTFYKTDKIQEKHTLDVPITQALKIVQSSIDILEINLLLDLAVKDEIYLYKNEIMQVILNIIKNAEDNFVEKNTHNPMIAIQTIKENNIFTIRIEDNGGGIKDEIINNIFNPYFSTKEEQSGTGLGLYMSKIMIEDHHGGKLKAYNIKNGVCFDIVLYA